MAGNEVTDVTAEPVEVTPSGEEPNSAGNESQDSVAKLNEMVAELQANLERAKQEAAEAQERAKEAARKAETEEKIRKGIQSSTTQGMQELALLRKQLEDQTITTQKLDRMEKLVSVLVERQLTPEEAEEIRQQMANEELRQENEKLKAERQAAQQRPQTLSPEYKRQLRSAYFPEYDDFDGTELSDSDWRPAGVRDEEAWKVHIRSVFDRLREEKQAKLKPAVDVEELTRRITEQVTAQFQAVRSADQEALNTATSELKTLKEQLDEQRRIAEEALNRAKGRDREGTPTSTPTPKNDEVLAAVSDSWLYGTDEQKKAYREAMNDKSLRDQIIARAQAQAARR